MSANDIVIYIAFGFIVGAFTGWLITRRDNDKDFRDTAPLITICSLIAAAVWPLTLCGIAMFGAVCVFRRALGKGGKE